MRLRGDSGQSMVTVLASMMLGALVLGGIAMFWIQSNDQAGSARSASEAEARAVQAVNSIAGDVREARTLLEATRDTLVIELVQEDGTVSRVKYELDAGTLTRSAVHGVDSADSVASTFTNAPGRVIAEDVVNDNLLTYVNSDGEELSSELSAAEIGEATRVDIEYVAEPANSGKVEIQSSAAVKNKGIGGEGDSGAVTTLPTPICSIWHNDTFASGTLNTRTISWLAVLAYDGATVVEVDQYAIDRIIGGVSTRVATVPATGANMYNWDDPAPHGGAVEYQMTPLIGGTEPATFSGPCIVSIGSVTVDTPVVEGSIAANGIDFELEWPAVPDAVSYTVHFRDLQLDSTILSYQELAASNPEYIELLEQYYPGFMDADPGVAITGYDTVTVPATPGTVSWSTAGASPLPNTARQFYVVANGPAMSSEPTVAKVLLNHPAPPQNVEATSPHIGHNRITWDLDPSGRYSTTDVTTSTSIYGPRPSLDHALTRFQITRLANGSIPLADMAQRVPAEDASEIMIAEGSSNWINFADYGEVLPSAFTAVLTNEWETTQFHTYSPNQGQSWQATPIVSLLAAPDPDAAFAGRYAHSPTNGITMTGAVTNASRTWGDAYTFRPRLTSDDMASSRMSRQIALGRTYEYVVRSSNFGPRTFSTAAGAVTAPSETIVGGDSAVDTTKQFPTDPARVSARGSEHGERFNPSGRNSILWDTFPVRSVDSDVQYVIQPYWSHSRLEDVKRPEIVVPGSAGNLYYHDVPPASFSVYDVYTQDSVGRSPSYYVDAIKTSGHFIPKYHHKSAYQRPVVAPQNIVTKAGWPKTIRTLSPDWAVGHRHRGNSPEYRREYHLFADATTYEDYMAIVFSGNPPETRPTMPTTTAYDPLNGTSIIPGCDSNDTGYNFSRCTVRYVATKHQSLNGITPRTPSGGWANWPTLADSQHLKLLPGYVGIQDDAVQVRSLIDSGYLFGHNQQLRASQVKTFLTTAGEPYLDYYTGQPWEQTGDQNTHEFLMTDDPGDGTDLLHRCSMNGETVTWYDWGYRNYPNLSDDMPGYTCWPEDGSFVTTVRGNSQMAVDAYFCNPGGCGPYYSSGGYVSSPSGTQRYITPALRVTNGASN